MNDDLLQSQFWFWSILISAASLLISSFISIFIFFMSSRVNRALKMLEINSKNTERVADLRAKLFEEVKGDINKIFVSCYLVGDWRNSDLNSILSTKRSIDKAMVESLPIWGSDVVEAYLGFVDVCFQVRSGRNTSPRLRADVNRYIEEYEGFRGEWKSLFMKPEDRKIWISSKLPGRDKPSYRNDLLMPAYMKLNITLASSMGVVLSEKQIRDMLS